MSVKNEAEPSKEEHEASKDNAIKDLPSPRWDVITSLYESMNEVYIKGVEKEQMSVFERKILVMMFENSVDFDKLYSMLGYMSEKQVGDKPIGIKGAQDIYK